MWVVVVVGYVGKHVWGWYVRICGLRWGEYLGVWVGAGERIFCCIDLRVVR